jgi:hypothetical protein
MVHNKLSIIFILAAAAVVPVVALPVNPITRYNQKYPAASPPHEAASPAHSAHEAPAAPAHTHEAATAHTHEAAPAHTHEAASPPHEAASPAHSAHEAPAAPAHTHEAATAHTHEAAPAHTHEAGSTHTHEAAPDHSTHTHGAASPSPVDPGSSSSNKGKGRQAQTDHRDVDSGSSNNPSEKGPHDDNSVKAPIHWQFIHEDPSESIVTPKRFPSNNYDKKEKPTNSPSAKYRDSPIKQSPLLIFADLCRNLCKKDWCKKPENENGKKRAFAIYYEDLPPDKIKVRSKS